MQELSLTQKREAFLIDMLEYYSINPVERRCIDNMGTCTYSYTTIDKPSSEGCAIGRKVPRELAIELDNCVGGGTVLAEAIHTRLPKNLIELEKMFLREVQYLHDKREHWTASGLSPDGIAGLRGIIHEYDLTPSLFKKYTS